MPAQKSENPFAKYKGQVNGALAEHANDPTDYGPQRLPGGIRGGVAQVVECKFDVYKNGDNQGEPYFRAAAVVLEPKTAMDGGHEVDIKGRQTSIMLPCHATKSRDGSKQTTQAKALAKVMNELRKMGADTSGVSTTDDLLELASQVKQARPFIRFSTSTSPANPPQFPQERVWENWNGNQGLEGYEPPEDEDAVDDQTGEEPQEEAPLPTPKKAPAKAPPPPAKKGKPAPEPEAPDEDALLEDLDSLAAAAAEEDDDDGMAARDKLFARATEAGISDEDANNAPTWPDLAALIAEAEAGGAEAEEEAEPEEWAPVAGKPCNYSPLDPKTKKPTKNPVECLIVSIDAKAKTATLKNLSNQKLVYKDVPLLKLSSPD
jgi:hypothetical protein